MEFPRGRLLPFTSALEEKTPRVGRIHRDGSITYRGKTYATIKELPADCLAMRLDVETYSEWKRLYRAIDPRLRGPRTKHLR